MLSARVGTTRSGDDLAACFWQVRADGTWQHRLHHGDAPVPFLRCDVCRAPADVTTETLTCTAGCPPRPLPATEPDSGWELAMAGHLSSNAVTDWRLTGFHDPAWDRYSAPTSPIRERFGPSPERRRDPETGRWGWMEVEGRETASEEGAYLARIHANDTDRIGEMVDAMRAFGEAVRDDVTVKLRGGRASEAVALAGCVTATAALQGYGQRGPIDPEVARGIRSESFVLFWGDAHCRSLMIREVGSAVLIELHRFIRMRGGSAFEITEGLHHLNGGMPRTTPFAGYNQVVSFWRGDHGTTQLGWGSALAHLGGAEATHTLSRGVQFNRMAVAPTKGGTVRTKNEGTLILAGDVDASVAAARVGGKWERVVKDGKDAAYCTGGRPLATWELRLVSLCDHGMLVQSKGEKGAQEDWRKLAPVEAVDIVRRESVKWADDPGWCAARHLTNKDGRAALRAARTALREAFEAWRLIPEREPSATEKPRPRGPVVSDVKPVQLPYRRLGEESPW